MSKGILKKGFNSLFFPPSRPPRIADDKQAFEDAWNSVGRYMQEAMNLYEESKEKEESS